VKNKSYVLKAIEIIRNNPSIINDVNSLWNSVVGPTGPVHNSQINVVIHQRLRQ